MLSKGAIKEIHPPESREGFYSNLFLVPKKDGGTRPVINLKKLNEFIPPQHFKMEGIHTLKDLLKENDWLTKVDLKDAYFMVPIHKTDRKFLRFLVKGSYTNSFASPSVYHVPLGSYQDPKASDGYAQRARGEASVLYRRHFGDGRLPRKVKGPHISSDLSPGEPRLYSPSRESDHDPNIRDREFLGMMIHAPSLELRLPGQKIKKLRAEANKLGSLEQPPSARDVSRVLGKMNSVSQAVPPAPLFYRHIQRDLARALEKGNQCYNVPCPLSEGARTDLDWWAHHLARWSGKSLLLRKPDLTIESDASLTGWGATSQNVRTGGPWSSSERTWHINCLELLAATLAVKKFLKGQTNKHVFLYLDNMTALAYINNLGGTVSLQATTLARDLWMWCLEKDIILSAQHLPGKQNVIADLESRVVRDRSDWMLNPKIFQKIQVTMGPMEVDLFASWLTNQLPRFFSWRPDPLAEATDAFLQDWRNLRGFANPPWNLVGRVLAKVKQQEANLILVAPIWTSQPWYPLLLSLLQDLPRKIQPQEDLLWEVQPGSFPEILPQLAVWPISGNTTATKEFLRKLQHSFSTHGESSQLNPMTRYANGGSAGVMNGVVIPFMDL